MIRRNQLRFTLLAPLVIGFAACTGAPGATPGPVGETVGAIGTLEEALDANSCIDDYCGGGEGGSVSRAASSTRRRTWRSRRTPRSAPRICSRPTASTPRATGGLTVAITDAFDYPSAESDLGHLPQHVRPAAVHRRVGLPHHREPGRQQDADAAERAGQRRLDRRDRARPRHGLGRLPELQDHPRAHQQRHGRRALDRAGDRGQARRRRHQQQLGRARGRHGELDVREVLPARRRRRPSSWRRATPATTTAGRAPTIRRRRRTPSASAARR